MAKQDWAYKIAKRAMVLHDAAWCYSLTVEECAKLLRTERAKVMRIAKKLDLEMACDTNGYVVRPDYHQACADILAKLKEEGKCTTKRR